MIHKATENIHWLDLKLTAVWSGGRSNADSWVKYRSSESTLHLQDWKLPERNKFK